MPCYPVRTKYGTMWGCQIGNNHSDPILCYKCGSLATKLCDHRSYSVSEVRNPANKRIIWQRKLFAAIKTCDKPMCDRCTHSVGFSQDFCDEHYNELSIHETQEAERIHQQQLEALGIEPEEGDQIGLF